MYNRFQTLIFAGFLAWFTFKKQATTLTMPRQKQTALKRGPSSFDEDDVDSEEWESSKSNTRKTQRSKSVAKKPK